MRLKGFTDSTEIFVARDATMTEMTTPVPSTSSSSRVACAEACSAAGRPVVVLLSGGRDSTCLLDLAVAIAGRSR